MEVIEIIKQMNFSLLNKLVNESKLGKSQIAEMAKKA